jgi:hypothetical protein
MQVAESFNLTLTSKKEVSYGEKDTVDYMHFGFRVRLGAEQRLGCQAQNRYGV